MRFTLSPDENPGNPGAVAPDGTQERNLNLDVCQHLQTALARCAQAVMFDPTITYVDRVARANADGTDVLVACAHNADTPTSSGTVFVFCPGGQTFGRQSQAAGAVYAELAKLPGWPARLADAVEDVYECCAFNRDTVYTEYLFMTPVDERVWGAAGYAQAAAEATCRGLAATYGFQYVPVQVPTPTPTPAWAPTPTTAGAHWWGPYVDFGGQTADQVVELPAICHAPVWEAGGAWYRGNTLVLPAVQGEYAEWTLANRIGGVWYVMDQSASGTGPQGAYPGGISPNPADAWWVEDADTDSSGCGGTNPVDVAKARGGRWWSL